MSRIAKYAAVIFGLLMAGLWALWHLATKQITF